MPPTRRQSKGRARREFHHGLKQVLHADGQTAEARRRWRCAPARNWARRSARADFARSRSPRAGCRACVSSVRLSILVVKHATRAYCPGATFRRSRPVVARHGALHRDRVLAAIGEMARLAGQADVEVAALVAQAARSRSRPRQVGWRAAAAGAAAGARSPLNMAHGAGSYRRAAFERHMAFGRGRPDMKPAADHRRRRPGRLPGRAGAGDAPAGGRAAAGRAGASASAATMSGRSSTPTRCRQIARWSSRW